VTCQVISSAPGTVTLGVTASTSAVHGTRVLNLNGGAGTSHVALADCECANTLSIYPSSIQAGQSTGQNPGAVISGLMLDENCENGDCAGPVLGIEAETGAGGLGGYITSYPGPYTLDVDLYASLTSAGDYGIYVNVCGGYWDPGGDNWLCQYGPAPFTVTPAATAPPTVTIQVPSAFVSMAGNGLVLMGGPGGLTTTAITAVGSPSGGTYTWTAGPGLQISGANSANTSVSGTAPSTSGGDTNVSVQYTLNGQSATATFPFTVLNPTAFQAAQLGGPAHATPYNSGGQTGYMEEAIYYVMDQMSPPNTIALPGIPATEVLTTTSNPFNVNGFSPPDNTPRTGTSNNVDGSVYDDLWLLVEGNMSPNFAATRSQSWTVNGYATSPNQVQVYGPTFATAQVQSLSIQH
jgi:hypothetical protein